MPLFFGYIRWLFCSLSNVNHSLPLISLTLSLLLAVTSVSSVLAEQKDSDKSKAKTRDEEYYIKVDVDLINVTATVTNEAGKFVTDLDKDDFAIYEDGKLQEITHFSKDYETPLSIGLLLDTSASMRDKLEDAKEALLHFTQMIHSGDDVFLIAFNDEIRLLQDFTSDRDALARAARGLEAGGYTALYDALLAGLEKIRRGRHQKKVLLLLTNGKDTASSSSLADVLKAARLSEALIYNLGISSQKATHVAAHELITDSTLRDIVDKVLRREYGGRPRIILPRADLIMDVDMRVLEALAKESGGQACYVEYYRQGGEKVIDQMCAQIAEEIRAQYSLGYVSSNKQRDGSWRHISAHIRNRNYRVRARSGYYAPKQ